MTAYQHVESIIGKDGVEEIEEELKDKDINPDWSLISDILHDWDSDYYTRGEEISVKNILNIFRDVIWESALDDERLRDEALGLL